MLHENFAWTTRYRTSQYTHTQHVWRAKIKFSHWLQHVRHCDYQQVTQPPRPGMQAERRDRYSQHTIHLACGRRMFSKYDTLVYKRPSTTSTHYTTTEYTYHCHGSLTPEKHGAARGTDMRCPWCSPLAAPHRTSTGNKFRHRRLTTQHGTTRGSDYQGNMFVLRG